MSSKSSGRKTKASDDGITIIAENRRARHDYALMDTYEAGVALLGCEVKSLRAARASIAEGYAHIKGGEAFLVNAHIPEYRGATAVEHYNPRRVRKLLLRARELHRIQKALAQKGLTFVPLRLFFNPRGLVKIDLAIAKGKKLYDKRESQKKRDWQREKAYLMKRSN